VVVTSELICLYRVVNIRSGLADPGHGAHPADSADICVRVEQLLFEPFLLLGSIIDFLRYLFSSRITFRAEIGKDELHAAHRDD